MDPREVPIYLLLPEGHPGLGATDLIDLVASRFPADAWRERIEAQGAMEVAIEHARWLITQREAPLSVPVHASTTRIFSFAHGVLAFTLDDLLRWFVDHGCVGASELETEPSDPPATPPDWTPYGARLPEPEQRTPQKHWLFDAEDPYAVLEAMGDTPDRPVLTIGHNDSEEPHEIVVVPVRYALDSRAEVEQLLARLERPDEDEDDAEEDEDDESNRRYDPSIEFERYWEALPPFPREAQGWMPAWLRTRLEQRVPRLAATDWSYDYGTEDDTFAAMAAVLREAGYVVTDEDLVPSVAGWVNDYEFGAGW
jgi:hypothetical protein